MQDQELYFIAIIPPEPIYNDVMELKYHLAENYESKAALRSPPHITLHMPFKWRQDKEERVEEVLKDLVSDQPLIDLELTGFGAFKPRTIFIQVEKNEPLSELHIALKKSMKRKLNIFNADYQDRPFHPHMTVAFRDLKKTQFTKAWEKLKSEPFEASFTVGDISLLKHNGKFWKVHQSFKFDSKN